MPESWVRASQDRSATAALRRAIRAERLRAGVSGLAPLTSALLEAAVAAPSREAEALVRLAEEASPDDPRPHGRLFLLDLRSFRLLSAAGELTAWVWETLRDPWIQASLTARSLAVLWAGAALTALGLVLAGCSAYGRLWFHDYRDAFPRRFRRSTPWAFAVLTLVALWSLGVGPWVWGALASICLAPYLPSAPRWALAGCLALSGALAPAVGWLAAPAQLSGERAWTLYRLHRGDSGAEVERALNRLIPFGDGEGLRARAALARQQGRYGEAAAFLQRSGTEGGGTRIELGNVRFLGNALDAAAAEYRKAAGENPADPIPWINLHLVHIRRLALPEADEALARAKVLDPDAVGMLRASDSLPLSPRVDESAIPAGLLDWRRPRGWTRDLTSALFIDLGHVPALWLGLIGAGAVLWAGTTAGTRRSRTCPSCGATVCPRCSRRIKESQLCPACWSLRGEKRIDADQKERQEKAVERWRERTSRRERTAQVLLPGWGECLSGRVSARVLVLGALWSLAGGALLIGLLYPVPVLPWAGASFPWTATALLAAAQLSGLRPARRRARR